MTDNNETGQVIATYQADEDSDSTAWETLKSSGDPEAFAAAWLELQCHLIENVTQAMVVFGFPDRGPFKPVAVWPEGSSGNPELAKAIETSVTGRQTIVQPKDGIIVIPLLVDNKICGSVALDVDSTDEATLNACLEKLGWGSVWLEAFIRRQKFTPSDRLVTVLELVATGLHNDRFQGSATAVATELAGILQCERVSIGFMRGKHSQVRALSHSASFSKKANLIRAIEAAMDEAIEQESTINFPVVEQGPMQVTKAHAELIKDYGSGSVCTIPLTEGERILGAITLERPDGEHFDSRTIQLSEHAATLVGPLLDIKRKDDRWLGKKAFDRLKHHTKRLVGPRNVGFKLSVLGIIAVITFFSISTSEFRVTADATLEGAVQRAIAAPMAGYVVQANVRAGDIVKQGDRLFSLDDRDLRLERLKWLSQKSQRTREYSEAQARHERSKVKVLGAQVDQANAQIALIDEQLKRVHAVAPFDGFVVSGDLSQSLGAPVERGDALFQIAPLNDYRVILNVNESEIGYLEGSESGLMALTGMPDETIDVAVEKITPISTAEEGNNFFRVEAKITSDISPKLRPGMDGVVKLYVDTRKTIWVWTYKLTHWVRMFFWSWWP